jgi:hypothetical protein
LANDASLILKDRIWEKISGVGMPPLKELFQFALDNQIRIFT